MRAAVDGQLDQVKTVADMLPLTKQIFDALGNKADRGALEGLYTKLADLTSKMDSLATRTAAAERAVSDATGKSVPSELSGNVAADSGVGSGQRFEERLGDIETELGGLADALRLLQEAFAPVEPRHEEVTAQIKEVLDTLANKADVPSLDELRLQIALASAGLPAGTADGDALMSAMQRVVADKATKAELEVVKKQLDTKASSDQHLSPAASPPALVLGGEGLGGLRGEGLQQPSATLAAKADLEALAQQAVGHKMDWFDPDVLNRMAQKLGTVDALMMNPAFRSMAQAPDAGMRDLENQLRR
ncbi:uncharacterized protein HaLaN_19232 [Haematococcus lacustris]|uniref:Uncharacterized protein n=1 Tax=Haematococcus lacustris TaxID=44745 RepID=A0A699ZGJ9_HAELA|nr:uncharacterized protein HaLaN_19232 [Haematococcus lacustris]